MDITVSYRIDPQGPTQEYTCSFGVALGIIQNPASGVPALRIKGALESHPAIIAAMAEWGELKDNLRNLVNRLEKLLPYSNPRMDGGWVKSAADCAARLNAALAVSMNPSELDQGILDAEAMIGRSGANLAKKAYYLAKTVPALDLAREYALAKRPELGATKNQDKLTAICETLLARHPARLASEVLAVRLTSIQAKQVSWLPHDSTTEYDSDAVGYLPASQASHANTGSFPDSYTTRDRTVPPAKPEWPEVAGMYPTPATAQDRKLARRMARKAQARRIGKVGIRDAILRAGYARDTSVSEYHHVAPTIEEPGRLPNDHDAHVESYRQHVIRLAAWQHWTQHWVTE